MIKTAISQAVEGRNLESSTMEGAMDCILEGTATAAQIAALVVALRTKGETAVELTAAARVLRRHAVPVKVPGGGVLLDTCGTGGDGAGTFNISTVSALVVAACGVKVAKHGNRAATSKVGGADVLEALGVGLEQSPEAIASSIDELGIGFMFARAHHPAMRHAAAVRAEIGVRTLFNFLGPLTNPAGATHQLLGVGDGRKLALLAEVLGELGSTAAWVVHGDGGLDEISLSGPTRVASLRDGRVERFELTPEDFGVPRANVASLAGGDAAHNAQIARDILAGEKGPPRDAVVANAAAALCVAGVVEGPMEGAQRAAAAIDSGKARATRTRSLAEPRLIPHFQFNQCAHELMPGPDQPSFLSNSQIISTNLNVPASRCATSWVMSSATRSSSMTRS